jgi:hypothetical protein
MCMTHIALQKNLGFLEDGTSAVYECVLESLYKR